MSINCNISSHNRFILLRSRWFGRFHLGLKSHSTSSYSPRFFLDSRRQAAIAIETLIETISQCLVSITIASLHRHLMMRGWYMQYLWLFGHSEWPNHQHSKVHQRQIYRNHIGQLDGAGPQAEFRKRGFECRSAHVECARKKKKIHDRFDEYYQ